jgi:hypothetical protein
MHDWHLSRTLRITNVIALPLIDSLHLMQQFKYQSQITQPFVQFNSLKKNAQSVPRFFTALLLPQLVRVPSALVGYR